MDRRKNRDFNDPEWIKELSEAFLDINIEKLSKEQRKLFREIYFEKINSGLTPKEAVEQAMEIVLCFIHR